MRKKKIDPPNLEEINSAALFVNGVLSGLFSEIRENSLDGDTFEPKWVIQTDDTSMRLLAGLVELRDAYHAEQSERSLLLRDYKLALFAEQLQGALTEYKAAWKKNVHIGWSGSGKNQETLSFGMTPAISLILPSGWFGNSTFEGKNMKPRESMDFSWT